MSGQQDFVGMNASAIALSNTTETAICDYIHTTEDIDLILSSMSFGDVGSNGEKVIFRIYLGADAMGGTPTTETLRGTGRATPSTLGTFKSSTGGGTIPGTKGNMVFREGVSQQAGFTNPGVIGITLNTRLLVTAQLVATDTANVYFRGIFRKPSLA